MPERILKPTVLWFTGLSGSGKSTISEQVVVRLRAQHYPVEHLDGDIIRDKFPGTGFSKAERNAHVKRVGFMAARLQHHGVFVVSSLVSPYRESRDWIRGECDDFTEIYVSTPIEVCEERDVKGLYAKARRGEIKQFTGIDDPYESPQNPELTIDTSHISLDEAVGHVFKYLNTHKSRTLE